MDLTLSFVFMLVGHSCLPNPSSTSLASELFCMISKKCPATGYCQSFDFNKGSQHRGKEGNDPDFYSYPLKGIKAKSVSPQKFIYNVFNDLNY